MKIISAYKNFWKGYFDFKGRTDPGGYWWAVLANFVVTFLLIILASLSSDRAFIDGIIYVLFFYSLACFLPSIAIKVRRLRDAGKSWTNLFWILLPFAGAIILIVKLCAKTQDVWQCLETEDAPDTSSYSEQEVGCHSKKLRLAGKEKAMENTYSREGTGTMKETEQIEVYSKTGYISEPKDGQGHNIVAVVWSLFLIMGGLSGRMVLRGTNSSPALVIVGLVFLAGDIISIQKRKRDSEKEAEKWYYTNKNRGIKEEEAAKDTRELSKPITIRIICDRGADLPDFGALLNGSWMNYDKKEKNYVKETSRVHNILTFKHLDLSVLFDIESIQENEVTFRLFKKGNRIGISVPEGLLLDEGSAN